jgi:hypothetical protein
MRFTRREFMISPIQIGGNATLLYGQPKVSNTNSIACQDFFDSVTEFNEII